MFYGYHSNHGVYYEVIDYGKLLSDSEAPESHLF